MHPRLRCPCEGHLDTKVVTTSTNILCQLSKTFEVRWCFVEQFSRGEGACSKLGAQITNVSLKSGCEKSSINLIEPQEVGEQMRTYNLTTSHLQCSILIGLKPFQSAAVQATSVLKKASV